MNVWKLLNLRPYLVVFVLRDDLNLRSHLTNGTPIWCYYINKDCEGLTTSKETKTQMTFGRIAVLHFKNPFSVITWLWNHMWITLLKLFLTLCLIVSSVDRRKLLSLVFVSCYKAVFAKVDRKVVGFALLWSTIDLRWFPWNSSTIKLFLKLSVLNIHDMNIKKMQ